MQLVCAQWDPHVSSWIFTANTWAGKKGTKGKKNHKSPAVTWVSVAGATQLTNQSPFPFLFFLSSLSFFQCHFLRPFFTRSLLEGAGSKQWRQILHYCVMYIFIFCVFKVRLYFLSWVKLQVTHFFFFLVNLFYSCDFYTCNCAVWPFDNKFA